MPDDTPLNEFTATHHVMLFAWMSRAVIERAGPERGEPLMRKAVRRYREQRGRRMALRAAQNGHALSMANFIAYGEWAAGEGEMAQEMVEKAPHARVLVHRRPWHQAWEANDLLPYGRPYCQEIDEALVRGFNPGLKLDVNSTRTNDGIPCEFVFHDASLTLPRLLALAYKKAVKPGKQAVMPWSYHLGHLFKTASEVIIQEPGETGREAVEAALAAFTAHYGEEAARIVPSYRSTDFDCLPE